MATRAVGRRPRTLQFLNGSVPTIARSDDVLSSCLKVSSIYVNRTLRAYYRRNGPYQRTTCLNGTIKIELNLFLRNNDSLNLMEWMLRSAVTGMTHLRMVRWYVPFKHYSERTRLNVEARLQTNFRCR